MTDEEDHLLCRVNLYLIDYDESSADDESEADNTGGRMKSSPDSFHACHPVNSKGVVSSRMYDLALPGDIASEHLSQLRTGKGLYVRVPGGRLSNDTVLVPPDARLQTVEEPPAVQRDRRLGRTATTGTLKLLILRIEAQDAQPDPTSSDIYHYTFESEVSLASQLLDCSLGQLHIVPAVDSYGVLDVQVPAVASGNTYKNLVNQGYASALSEMQSRGNPSLEDIRDLADLIMVVLPPGTGNWKGFASVGGQQSVFNNAWATYVGATAHEIGHNLGLRHAFQSGLEYGDVTGYMGGAPSTTDHPTKCYNAQNHWHLGWYAARSIEVDPYSTAPSVYSIVPFVDYNKSEPDQYAIVKLTGLGLYMQYNRKKSFNAETGELEDRLVIVRDTGDGTDQLAGLNDDDPWWLRAYDSKVLTIEVCSTQLAQSDQAPDVMRVSIGFGASECPTSRTPSSAPIPSYASSHPRSKVTESAIFPVALASVAMMVVVSLVAVFVRASRRKPGIAGKGHGKGGDSDRGTDSDRSSSDSLGDDPDEIASNASDYDLRPYGDTVCSWNWFTWTSPSHTRK